jgi:phosphoglycerate dehydrogenase-like enzyme
VIAAVREAGGEPGEIDLAADALVWLDEADLDELTRALAAAPAARWVQLPFAGVELVAGAGLLDPARTWTCAKGAYAEPAAEHALMLALARLRLRRRIGVWSWGMAARESLYDQPVTIVGGGGIAARLLELLAPMRLRHKRGGHRRAAEGERSVRQAQQFRDPDLHAKPGQRERHQHLQPVGVSGMGCTCEQRPATTLRIPAPSGPAGPSPTPRTAATRHAGAG